MNRFKFFIEIAMDNRKDNKQPEVGYTFSEFV